MRFKLLILLTIFTVTFLPSTLAQVADPKTVTEKVAKEKMARDKARDERIIAGIDQAIADAGSLRLPQNRAVVFALAGDLYWKFDEKRSRDLFRSVGVELANHNAESETEKRENAESGYGDAPDTGNLRSEILPLIGARDAALAIELMMQTRPAGLADSMARFREEASDGGGIDPERFRANGELGLEQSLARLLAAQDPEKAITLIKESLAKGTLANWTPVLQSIHTRDPKKAADLASEILRKLIETDMVKIPSHVRTALAYLHYATRPPPPANLKEKIFVLPDTQVRELANLVASAYLRPAKSSAAAMDLVSALPTLEKLVPDKIVLLRQRVAENRKTLPPDRNSELRQSMAHPAITPEEMLSTIAKLPEIDRQRLYSILGSKISQIEDEARAKKLIEQIPDERFRGIAQQQFEMTQARRLVGTGRIDDARKSIAAMSNRRMRIQQLSSLAVRTKTRGGSQASETAGQIMAEAKAMVREFPEDEDDLNDLLEVIKGYAVVEPDTAFRLFEPLVEQFNEIVQATAVLSKYNRRERSFKKGELVMHINTGVGGPSILRFLPQMQALGRADFERTSTLVARFARADVRTLTTLQLLRTAIAAPSSAPQMITTTN